MNSRSSSWQKFHTCFFNSTLRFSILRAICILAILLLCNVPTDVLTFLGIDCNGMIFIVVPTGLHDSAQKYERMCMIYSYFLYSFTFFHHFASAFGPRFSLPAIVDFAFIIGETALFMVGAICGRWAVPIPRMKETVPLRPGPTNHRIQTCKVTTVYLGVPTTVAVFTWAISLLLFLSITIRFAQALATNGKYPWTRYDIQAGLDLKPKHETRPTGRQVLLEVGMWKPHFKSEGIWIVRSRGTVAITLIVLILLLALNSLIIDPIHETDEVLVKNIISPDNPAMQSAPDDLNVIVGSSAIGPFYWDADVSEAIRAVTIVDGFLEVEERECRPTPREAYKHPLMTQLSFINFRCSRNSPVSVFVNFTKLLYSITDSKLLSAHVMVIIGHSNDTSTIIRRTELPVILQPGVDLLGFAHHRKVRQFRNPRLAAFGLFPAFDEFIMTEITHLQPNIRFVPQPTSNDSASLMVLPRPDHSDLRIIQDYRERSVLKGFSDIGGLWTTFAFIFGAFFGSSLLRVAFGVKPVSIVGLAHNTVEQETLQKYRDAYPFLDSDIEELRARPGLLTLLVNHLIDLKIFTKPDAIGPPDALMSEEVTSNTHHANELAVEEPALMAPPNRRDVDSESMLESEASTQIPSPKV